MFRISLDLNAGTVVNAVSLIKLQGEWRGPAGISGTKEEVDTTTILLYIITVSSQFVFDHF